jgi:hypothetical protein
MNYKFVGEGMGVPGLPHVISDEEAEEQGLTELLRAAIENGNYQMMNAEGGMQSDKDALLSAEAQEE